MLLNLLDNSIKYTPNGGAVSVAAQDSPDGATISVSNNGPGIPPELQPRIFERFFRGDQTRTRSDSARGSSHTESGAGLGLSISKWIAEAHHGSLGLTSSGPAGTVFTAHLPKPSTLSTRTD